ncbi:MAG: radical SAM protein, partial [Longimicrobiales bacterium]
RTGALPLLLRALLAETAIPWLRLFYMYPSGITRELVELMATESRVVPYLDMPIQHGSDAVLQRMRRPERNATIRERVAWLREALPDVALRTTVIIGFPGETEDDFERLVALLEEIGFDHVGVFAYSVEEGTAAAAMTDLVADSLVRERVERVEELQRSIGLERNEAWVGRETMALIDRWLGDERGEAAEGRTPRQALEVDGTVLVRGAGGVRPGEFTRIRIVEAQEQDVIAVVV